MTKRLACLLAFLTLVAGCLFYQKQAESAPLDDYATCVNQYIVQNNKGAITGTVLNNCLNKIIPAIAATSNASNLISGTLNPARLPNFTGDCISAQGTNILACASSLQNGLLVTNSNIGMASGGQDNSPMVPALMNAIANPPVSFGGGGVEVKFPAVPGQAQTSYYFSKQVSLTRGGTYNCPGSTGFSTSGINLVFAPGVDGLIQETFTTSSDPNHAYSRSFINNCAIINLGNGTGVGTVGSPTITSAVFTPPPSDLPSSLTPRWGAGDGIIAFENFQVLVASTGHITGNVLTLDSPATNMQLGYVLDGFNIPANTVTTALASGTLGATGSTYTLNNTLLNPTTTGSQVLMHQNAAGPVTAPGAYLDAASTAAGAQTLTLHTGFTPSAVNSGLQLFDLPAAQGFQVSCTSGSPTMTVTSAPTGNPTRLWQGGDIIWSPCFAYGAAVLSAPTGAAGAQTMTVGNFGLNVPQNAIATGTYPAWIVPAAVKRRIQAYTSRIYTSGFMFGVSMMCSGNANLNCTASSDIQDAFDFASVGWMASGNNVGASTTFGNVGLHNFYADFIDNGTVGSAHFGDNSNAAEASRATNTIAGNCNYNTGAVWYGGYYGNPFASYCLNAAGIGGPSGGAASSPPLVVGTPGGVPPDIPVQNAAQFNHGLFTFGSSSGAPCYRIGAGTNALALFSYSPDCQTADSVATGFDQPTQSWLTYLHGSSGIINERMTINGSYTGYVGDSLGYKGFPRGFLMGSGPTVDRLFDASSSAQNASTNLAGDTRFNLSAAPGGNIGWVVGSGGGAGNAYPFGPVSNSKTFPYYTVKVLRSGQSGNSDLNGRLTLSGGTASLTFTGTYTNKPVCTANDETALNVVKPTVTTTGVTFTGTGTDVIAYQCMGTN